MRRGRLPMVQSIMEHCRMVPFALRSITYNSFTDKSAMVDIAMEPLLWLVEKITKYLGPVSVTDAIYKFIQVLICVDTSMN